MTFYCFLQFYSSEQSTKAKTQKELLKTLQELKAHLPSEKRIKGKSSVLMTLKYALKSIKQVKGKQLWYYLDNTNLDKIKHLK